ncbi:MAG: TIGR01620 family protein [Hyphomicrobiales bacterium]|nr:TIGR01620 family protein [Hyphomicrobiales bacterium]
MSAAPPHVPNRPRAFRLEGPEGTPAAPAAAAGAAPVLIEPQAHDFALEAMTLASAESLVEAAQKAGFAWRWPRWGGVLGSALAGLVSLALGVWITRQIEALLASSVWLGDVALGLLGIAALAAVVLGFREVLAIRRQRAIAALHAHLAQARASDDARVARRLVHELAGLYSHDAASARARAEIARMSGEIIDGRDLIDATERLLMHPLDATARGLVAQAARRVSMVTALSPRAVLDVVFAAGQMVWLLRRISVLYGGRPGWFGFLRLLRAVTTHLVITGTMALGDSILQQLVGHGIAAKLSAKLGEGVLNGLLTARVGIAAMQVCRPMPFTLEPAPGLKEVVPELFSGKITTPPPAQG